MWDVLDTFGLGGEFSNWMKVIYHSPEACVLTNGVHSSPFPLHRGTRQGCPLSPLLFALTLEPLAERIRNHQDIHGVTLGRTVHKMALYADDIILFVTRPEISVPAILSVINAFSLISGYKVNDSKSEAMPLGDFGSINLLSNFPFRWATSGFVYLGIKVSPNTEDLGKLNFTSTIRALKKDLERWHDLPLSWLGRISLIKMSILPRLLYPLQMLPLWIPRKVLLDLEKTLSRFIWHSKKPRIRMRTLQLTGERGGLALPNLRFYNWACHTRIIWEWLQSHLNSVSSVDEWYPTQFSLLSKLTSGARITLEMKDNPIIHNTFKVWQDMIKFVGKNIPAYGLIALSKNEGFAPGIRNSVFDIWHTKGIRLLADLYQENMLMSFQQLQEKYSIPSAHFFGYLQVRNFIQSKMKNLPPDTPPFSDF